MYDRIYNFFGRSLHAARARFGKGARRNAQLRRVRHVGYGDEPPLEILLTTLSLRLKS